MFLSPVAVALVLCALTLPVSIAGTNLALGLLTLALLAAFARRRAGGVVAAWRRTPAVWGLFAYCATGLIATACGVDPAHSLRDNAKDLHKLWSLLVFVAAFQLEAGDAAWAAFGAGFAATALVGLGQLAVGVREHLPGFPLPRAHGFVHPVTYGEQLTLALLGSLAAWARPAGGLGTARARRALAAFLVLIALALVANQTRMTVFALAAGFGAICFFDAPSRRRGVWLAAAVTASVALWEFMPAGDRRSLIGQLFDFNPYNPQNARYTLWSVAWRMFRDHPLTGVGPANFGGLFTSYFQGTLDNERVWSSSHNLYLHQLAERGLIGGLGLAAALGAFAHGAWNAARRVVDARSIWAVASVAAFLLMNLSETAFQNEQLTTLLLFVWAWGTTSLRTPGEFL